MTMSVTVKIFTKQAGRPTLFQTREFDALPVTIGRDAGCTVALEDPLKHISRVHVELAELQGACWLSVVSKVSAVLVKGSRHGPGSRVQLQSGDSFEMGEFEVQVTFANAKGTPPAEAPVIDILLGEDDAPLPLMPEELPPPEPGFFDEPTPVPSDEPTYMGPAVRPPSAPSDRAPKSPRPASLQDAVNLLLEGAGMPGKELTAAESENLLRESGAVLRAAVEGLMALLLARNDMRDTFQAQERTMVSSRGNNPLKLMGDAQEAMEFLFDPAGRGEGFLGPVQAVTDSAKDLRAHELALMAGMRGAILGAVRRFDAQLLEKALAASAGGFSFGGRKAKMWDLLPAYQQKLLQETQEDFNKAFGREFLAAYEAHLRGLKTR